MIPGDLWGADPCTDIVVVSIIIIIMNGGEKRNTIYTNNISYFIEQNELASW